MQRAGPLHWGDKCCQACRKVLLPYKKVFGSKSSQEVPDGHPAWLLIILFSDLCYLLCVMGWRAGQALSYWDQIPTRKELISTFHVELGGTLISNNDGSQQGEAVSGRSLQTWPTMSKHTGILQTDYFHPNREKGAVKGSQHRPPSLPLKYLTFFFVHDKTQGCWHQDTRPSARKTQPTRYKPKRYIRHWKRLSLHAKLESLLYAGVAREAVSLPVVLESSPYIHMRDTCQGSSYPLSGPKTIDTFPPKDSL